MQPASSHDVNKKFSVYEASLEELLNLSKDQLVIPSYQRPYEWKSKEVQVLLSDLKKSHISKVPPEQYILLGSVMLFQQSKGDPLQVVDGQQRLSTMMLIYSVLFRCLKEAGELSKKELQDLSARFVKNERRILVLNNALAGDATESADAVVESWDHLTDFSGSILTTNEILNSKSDKYCGRWNDIYKFVNTNFKSTEAIQKFRAHLDNHVYISITKIQHLSLALQSFVRCNSTGKP